MNVVNLTESNLNIMEFNISLVWYLSLFALQIKCHYLSSTGQAAVIQLLDWILRGVAQVMFTNNSLSGLFITAGLFLQDPWWALNGLLGTFVSTVSAILLRQNRSEAFSNSFLIWLYHRRRTIFFLLWSSFVSFTYIPWDYTLCSFHTVLFSVCISFNCVFTHVGYTCHIHLREAVSMGLHGYNGTLVGILMAVFSANGSWYWWLLLPNIFMSMLW